MSAFERRQALNQELQDRFRGCLLGGAVGDALGAPVEFMNHARIVRQFGLEGIGDYVPAYGKLGAITDDTQMMLFTAEGVLRAFMRSRLRGICHPPSVIHYAYLRWLSTQGGIVPEKKQTAVADGWLIQHKELFAQRAPGATCIDALSNEPKIGKPATNNSKGCGGIMRVAPIGMFFYGLTVADPSSKAGNYHQSFTMACDAAALTHGHPTGFLTAGVMAAIVFDMLDGSDLPLAIERAVAVLKTHESHEETLLAIELALRLHGCDTAPPEAIHQLGQGWIAEEALAIGLYCALKAKSFEDGVRMAVNHDGDSDSTGLIAGHFLGAMLGIEAIPSRWLEPLELRSVIDEMAQDLLTAGTWRLDQWDDPEAMKEEAFYANRYPGG